MRDFPSVPWQTKVNYYHRVHNFPSDMFVEGFKHRPKGLEDLAIVPPTMLSASVKEWAAIHSLEWSAIAFFYRQNVKIPGLIHIDMPSPDNPVHSAINVELEGCSLMHFYRALSKGSGSKREGTSSYISFRPDEVELIETIAINGPTLVRPEVPHNVDVIIGPRLLASLRFVDRQTKQSLSWSETEQRLGLT
jgi:hypothetical protein